MSYTSTMNIRIFKTKFFAKWQNKELITNQDLIESVSEMEKGLIDANLGGNIYKKRIAKHGQGKSGSFRTIIAFKIDDRAFFIYGFSKNKKENIKDNELKELKFLSDLLLKYSNEELNISLEKGTIEEVK